MGLKPTGLTSLKLTPQSCVNDNNPVQAKVPETDSVMEIYEPFLCPRHEMAEGHIEFTLCVCMFQNRVRAIT